MSEWGILAITVGAGCFFLGKSKKVGEVEKAAKAVKMNGGNFSLNISKILQSHEYAGGFKEGF
jgi:hypothetical protein